MSISKEQFWNKIGSQNSPNELNDLFIKIYQKSLQESMWLIYPFVYHLVRRKFNRSPEDFTKGLLEEYKRVKKLYVETNDKLDRGLVPIYDIREKKANQSYRLKFVTVMEEYKNFIKCIELGHLTTLDLIDKLIKSHNNLPQNNLELKYIYWKLEFTEVVSFGFDDGKHDVLETHFGFWSEIFQIGYVMVKDNIESHFDDLEEMNTYLNSLKDGLKSPF